MRVVIVHDHLVQRGGAERVALTMATTFQHAPVYTSFYEPALTYGEFSQFDVRPFPLNWFRALRRRHRGVAPLLAPWFSRLRVEADVLLCSSAGWAHAVPFDGPKLVYFHSPARWLYDTDAFVGTSRLPTRIATHCLRPILLRWDQSTTSDHPTILTNSELVRRRVRAAYGLDASVLAPGSSLLASDRVRPVEGIAPGFVLCVSRLLPYKNVGHVVGAFAELAGERLVVVGTGPEEGALRAAAPRNVSFLGVIDDDELRWLYANCRMLVAASYEDFGLTPIEAAHFGKPSVVLRRGGYLETTIEGVTGCFFDTADALSIAASVRETTAKAWDRDALMEQARSFGEARFADQLRSAVVRTLEQHRSREHDSGHAADVDLREPVALHRPDGATESEPSSGA